MNPIKKTPINRLFFAINHYISTGDHIGEGVAEETEDGRMRIVIPVNRTLPQDQKDWECFRSRFEELRASYHLRLEWMGVEGRFEAWAFRIRENQIDDLARELRDRPGPLGWGSLKAFIDSHQWEGE